MKNFTLLVCVLIAQISGAQSKMISANAQIVFEASVPFFEPIKAIDKKVMVTFDTQTQTLECISYIKNYEFELQLMRQQFNENYMESNRYPKAIFKGKIQNFQIKDVENVSKEYVVIGKIQVHGRSKVISVKAWIEKTSDGILIRSNFILDPTEFKIEIPSTIAGKIAKTVNANLVATLQ